MNKQAMEANERGKREMLELRQRLISLPQNKDEIPQLKKEISAIEDSLGNAEISEADLINNYYRDPYV